MAAAEAPALARPKVLRPSMVPKANVMTLFDMIQTPIDHSLDPITHRNPSDGIIYKTAKCSNSGGQNKFFLGMFRLSPLAILDRMVRGDHTP
jgi:hypothetical protein